MRSTKGIGGRWLAAAAAAAAGIASALLAASAAGVTNLYVAQSATSPGLLLSQYAVAPTGSLTALASAALGTGAQDLAITPDGRFAYVTRSAGTDQGTIEQFARSAADGRMVPAGSVAADADPRGILVNPQGTRVIYANAVTRTLHSRPIGVTGALDAATVVPITVGAPRFLAMTPSGTSLYVSIAGLGVTTTGIAQFDVNPISGAIAPKPVAFVAWPGTSPPLDVTRMTVSPDGRDLYAANGETSSAMAHFSIDASGALTGASVIAIPRGSATSVVAVAPVGLFAWAPTSSVLTPPGQILQFSRDPATGLLAPLFLPTVAYPPAADLATRDAIPSPDGASLYLGQNGNVGEWTVSSGGALLPRANLASPIGGVSNAGIALAPSQAPIASFTAVAAPAGQPTTFDARSSSDPDGTVARYDWDFGDGTSLASGGPQPSHVYASPGSPRIALTVTDADGTSTAQLWTGSRMLRNGGPSAQTSSVVQIAAPPPPPPPPPAGPLPDKGKSVTVTRVSGKVLVRIPRAKRYVDLRTLTEIPLGSRVDARRGQVRLTAEVDARTHATQSSLFYAGIFGVSQTKGAKPILVASILGGTFTGCQPGRAAAAVARATAGGTLARPDALAASGGTLAATVARAAPGGALAATVARPAPGGTLAATAARAAPGGTLARPFALVAKRKRAKRAKRVVRRLWGRGEGDFRTQGKRSSATVRGTWWLVEDRCDGTLTRVRQGFVDVRDTRLKKTVRLRAGGRSLYLAKAP